MADSQGKVPFSWENKPGMSTPSMADSQGKLLFSWGNKPGISKVIRHEYPTELRASGVQLPLPPCPSKSSKVILGHDLHIPLPPCPFLQTPSRSSSRKGLRQNPDPFAAAYKECTKSSKVGSVRSKRIGCGSGVLTRTNMFSCKHSSDVIDEGLLKLSQISSVFRDRRKTSI